MSSDLQLSLAVVGGVFLIGIVAFNAWSARRNRPRQARPDSKPAPRVSPDLDSLPGRARSGGVGPSSGYDSDFNGLGPMGFTPGGAGLGTTAEKHPHLDALIDVIVPIAFDGRVVSGEALIAAMPATRRVGTKPFAVEGLNAANGQWEFPTPGHRYRAVQAGVQLTNRNGALNEIGYSEFVYQTQVYADAIGGEPEVPEMTHQIARARELDLFASNHDAQLNFTLRSRGAVWSPGFVQQQAARFGFVPGVIPGRLVLPAAEAGMPPVLDLSFDPQAALAANDGDQANAMIREVTLGLDVPQVQRESQPYARMTEAAFALAQSMNGVITDDVGQPLEPRMIESIGADLEQLYDTLEAHDLAAGSPQARRLFS